MISPWRIPIGYSEHYKAQPWWVSTWRIIEANDPMPDDGSGIGDISNETLRIEVKSGKLVVTSDKDGMLRIYGLDGMIKKSITLSKGETVLIDMPRGLYIINNKKVLLK